MENLQMLFHVNKINFQELILHVQLQESSFIEIIIQRSWNVLVESMHFDNSTVSKVIHSTPISNNQTLAFA
ncbi:hypothetical protein LguiA_021859 [Lonicera macranthoides]